MAMNLDGKVAVVTGATKGVGRGIGRELAHHGARVFVTGRSARDRESLAERTTAITCDHRDDAQVAAAFELILRESGAIDILVNNVWGGYERMIDSGEFTWPPVLAATSMALDAMFAAGVRAHYHASQLAAPSMVAQGAGSSSTSRRLLRGSTQATWPMACRKLQPTRWQPTWQPS